MSGAGLGRLADNLAGVISLIVSAATVAVFAVGAHAILRWAWRQVEQWRAAAELVAVERELGELVIPTTAELDELARRYELGGEPGRDT